MEMPEPTSLAVTWLFHLGILSSFFLLFSEEGGGMRHREREREATASQLAASLLRAIIITSNDVVVCVPREKHLARPAEKTAAMRIFNPTLVGGENRRCCFPLNFLVSCYKTYQPFPPTDFRAGYIVLLLEIFSTLRTLLAGEKLS